MTDKEFSQLQNLVTKLQSTAEQASRADQTFKRYHLSSLDLLEELPAHLSQLKYALKVVENNPVNSSKATRRTNLSR